MFTGIITDIGEIIELEQRGDLRARIKTAYKIDTIDLGASIANDGVCLTVIETGADWFDVEISAESVSKTNIGAKQNGWKLGRSVNLERALKVGDELGGHLVSGHVDGIAIITDIQNDGDSTRVEFEAPEALAKFIAQKGSVTLNGTSLTVNGVNGNRFDVNLIPHTKTHTTWGDVALNDQVNLEIDTLARYVARLVELRQI
ncbi:riboflavin synthase subunit alpha [Amylibacter kogurei]|uniref:Riboflavin synthase n=1 Tax=Paramylibacter kogurei TaxID=1889778 RepID=A0A2G5K696_9RHOB|nr:riboflavin synthase [Amylibacter kogurei]PIB24400.1 riboflavin synthase subunit alpha [Amylibacter kogurei]